jgi:hypothetical protein
MLSPDQAVGGIYPDPRYVGQLPPRVGPKDATDLLLSCVLCPGDTVVMTAAVRDLHRAYPGQFRTAVNTSAMELWANNPHVIPANQLSKPFATINWGWTTSRTNERPRHLLQIWADELAQRIGAADFPITEFRGDLHLSDAEKQKPACVSGVEPYWVIMAGGKKDCQTKLWPAENWQPVIDRFAGKIKFVQCGVMDVLAAHAPLKGVIDLRGKTTVREFLSVIRHAAGMVCPITFAMHLSAAIDMPSAAAASSPSPPLRPCVVIAGGREPPHMIAYPGHTVLHRVGRMPCTRGGSCWKDFVVDAAHPPNPWEHPHQRCIAPMNGYAACMRQISVDEVCRAIEACL